MTPLTEINGVYFKREDLNPTGSAKDRSLPLQVKALEERGFKEGVISSTGNGAVSAVHYCHQLGIKLTVFVSPKINPAKLALIHADQIITSPQPISDSFKYAKKNHVYLLRQSTDPIALLGYSQISLELKNQIPDFSSIFIPVGSGTTLLGISQTLPPTVKIFACQPASHPIIATEFDHSFTPETETCTDALGVKFIPLKPKVITAIKISGGSGIVVQDIEVASAQNYLTSHGIITSAEGALAFAAFQKAGAKNLDPGLKPVILLTGTPR